jgi:hypothetical protein
MTDESATVDLLRASMDANRLNWGDRVAGHLRNRAGFDPIDRVRAGDNDLHWRRDAPRPYPLL